MERFLIKSAAGAGYVEFHDRIPADPDEPLEEYAVTLCDHGVSATARVYAGYLQFHPTPLFADMARDWRGWSGEKEWESLEGELRLRCSRDRFGHVFVRVRLRSGIDVCDWCLAATVMVEAGQLQSIAAQAARFFGEGLLA